MCALMDSWELSHKNVEKTSKMPKKEQKKVGCKKMKLQKIVLIHVTHPKR
jgi:hypothetical protein